MLLRWDGASAKLGSYAAGQPAVLLGALADRLVLLRSSAGRQAIVSTRMTALLPILIQAWASLVSSGLLPGVQPARMMCVAAWDDTLVCMAKTIAVSPMQAACGGLVPRSSACWKPLTAAGWMSPR